MGESGDGRLSPYSTYPGHTGKAKPSFTSVSGPRISPLLCMQVVHQQSKHMYLLVKQTHHCIRKPKNIIACNLP